MDNPKRASLLKNEKKGYLDYDSVRYHTMKKVQLLRKKKIARNKLHSIMHTYLNYR